VCLRINRGAIQDKQELCSFVDLADDYRITIDAGAIDCVASHGQNAKRTIRPRVVDSPTCLVFSRSSRVATRGVYTEIPLIVLANTPMNEGKLLRDRLRAGSTCLGTFNSSSDPCITELLCGSGYEFIVIDAEHGALNIETVQACIMAAKGSGTVPLIRVPNSDEAYIKWVLDAGAGGIVVPQVQSAEDVERAVSACLYPPRGTRGFGPRRPSDYERNYEEVVRTANDHIVVIAQIEIVNAVNDIERIVAVPDLAAIIIGPGDLSVALGAAFDKKHPTVLEAIDRVKSTALAANMPVGMAGTSDPETAIGWLRQGFQVATLGNTNGMLMRASRNFVDSVRRGVSEE